MNPLSEKLIEENKELLTQKVKGMLDEIEYSIIDINTAYSDDLELNNGTTIKAYNTSFISYETLFSVIVTTNAETMEMLHVQTRPTKYMTVNEFFKIEEN